MASIGHHLRAVFVTSYFIAVFEVAAVALVVRGGWPIAFTSGTGAAFGMVTAILLHDKLFKEVLLLEGRYRYGHKGAVKFKPCDPEQVFDDELACAKFMRQIAGPAAAMQGMPSSDGKHYLGIWKSPKDCKAIKLGGARISPAQVSRIVNRVQRAG